MSNFNFNQVFLGGRLTADPDMRTTQDGRSVCHFRLAVARRDKSGKTDFYNATAWDRNADTVNKYFGKGSAIFVVGEIRNSPYTDRAGVKHFADEVVVSAVRFVDSKSDAAAAPKESAQEADGEFGELPGDEDLPF